MEQAHYVLCPCGSGRTSWRLVETIQLGSIPIHIWDDYETLPYNHVNTFMWENVGLSIHIDHVRHLPEILAAQPLRTVHERLLNIHRLRKWFTLAGSVEYVLRTVSGDAVVF